MATTTLWFPPSYFSSGAVADAEMVAGQNGLLLSSMETAPGVYEVPSEFAQTVQEAIPALVVKPTYIDFAQTLSPVAYWPLAEASGNAIDLIGARTLIPTGGAMLRAQPSILPNGEGASVLFSGANGEYLRQDIDDSTFDFTGLAPFSVSAWGQSTNPDGGSFYVISKRATVGTIGGNIFFFRQTTNTPALYRYDSAGVASNANAAANLMQIGDPPIHYVGTYDGVTMRTYVNGVLSGTPLASSRVQNDSSVNLTVGGPAHTTTLTLAGSLQEVGFWNRQLSDDEIESLWRTGH